MEIDKQYKEIIEANFNPYQDATLMGWYRFLMDGTESISSDIIDYFSKGDHNIAEHLSTTYGINRDEAFKIIDYYNEITNQEINLGSYE